jgi:polysaccharide deacetylase family protein (PEP-CTERM system associated)
MSAAVLSQSVANGHVGHGAAARRIILSFDVEEHHRIEAAAGMSVSGASQARYLDQVESATDWLLELLDEHAVQATFFVLGTVAAGRPALVRRIHAQGHEIASHGWGHDHLSRLTAGAFRDDVRRSKQKLEDTAGAAVLGYRAPTFSITPRTAWAIDVLAELGFVYDSSIYPVRHDRYGAPDAPRQPFVVRGPRCTLLELPPATLRVGPMRLPVGGGGYFRLLPLGLFDEAIDQTRRECSPAVTMLYFHPWEFEPRQERLPLRGLNRWRTYVGLYRSRTRLRRLLRGRRFSRAIDVARELTHLEGVSYPLAASL